MPERIADVVLAPGERAPFPVQAVIVEEDTGLVLSANTELRISDEHPIRLMMALWDFEPERPGSVVLKGRNPYRLFAIVHDFDQEPACRNEWVTEALGAALAECSRLRVHSVATQVLGSRHGPISREWFVTELERALWRNQDTELRRIWVIA